MYLLEYFMCMEWIMTLHLVQKLYAEAWEEEKTLFYPYSDSPELRRVAKAQEALSDVSWIHYQHPIVNCSKYIQISDLIHKIP